MWRPSSISKVFRSWSLQIIRARGVDRAGRYEPDLNRMYLDMATPYAIAVMPARPRKPRDKAKVENALPSGNCRAVAAGRLGCVRLSSLCPFRLLHTFPSSRPTRNYPRLWIRRSSFERRRDLNPPESRAAQAHYRSRPSSTIRRRVKHSAANASRIPAGSAGPTGEEGVKKLVSGHWLDGIGQVLRQVFRRTE